MNNSQSLYYPRGNGKNNLVYGAPPETSEAKISRLVAEIVDTNTIHTKIAKYNEIIAISQGVINSLQQQQNGGKRRKAIKTRKNRSK
jgi:hypothetical protein